MDAQREMTLDEWCAQLHEGHLVNRQLRALRTPQPVTPAGGEVFTRADLNAEYARGRADGWEARPPVADAALPIGHRVEDGKQLALLRDAERYRWLRNDALYYAYASSGLRPMPWCAIGMDKRNFRLAEKEDLDAAIDAALNQRGGGSNG